MRILILDDDVLFAHMLAQQLERLMAECLVASVDKADAARAAVRNAADPFDVLLLDVRLDGSDVDGVTLMTEMKQATPTSDAIVFTGYGVEEGLRASDAGAYSYLTKPFDTRELVRILTVLQRDRETRRERDWLTILAEAAAQMQGTDDIHALADIIVRGGLRFGFRRARLRLFERTGQEAATDPELVSVSQAGEPRVDGFEGLRAPLSTLIYSQRAIAAGQPVCFDGREFGPGVHDEFYAAHGTAPPQGHWFKTPLLSGGHPVGALTLDNGEEKRFFGGDVIRQLTQVLALFGSQAADALERARLRELERRQADEARLLSDISRQVTAAAAQGDLDALLDEVRDQVGSQMDVTNFMVVLHNPETKTIDFRRQYEETNADGEPEDRHWRTEDAGLSGYVIAHNQAVLTSDTEEFRKQHKIKPYGRRAECWLGVPLRVGDNAQKKAVGALVVQSYQEKAAYSEHHKRLLQLVADQVAGAIHLSYELERKADRERQEEALRALKAVIPELIREPEEIFWHAVQTTVTHHDGNSFNRAILLWYDQTGERLLGRMAIGQLNRTEVREVWKRDLKAGHTLVSYFVAPRKEWANPTPLQKLIVGASWPVGEEGNPCRRLRSDGQRLKCRSDALRGCLPDEVLFPPDLLDDETTYDCALLPVRSREGVLGVLIVDNAFDSEPLRPGDLDSLEQVLNAAIEAWLQAAERRDIQRSGERYETMLALERSLIAQAASQELKTSLEALCQRAKELSGADAVVIYPYQASSGSYDLKSVAYVGLTKQDEFHAKHKPRQQGVTFTVLQSGTLVVPDVTRFDTPFGRHRLAEHDFLNREGVQALIATPIRQAVTGEPLGVLYLDYRSPQKFDDQDIALAEHLAAVGAAVINAGREAERQQEGRTAAERSEQQRRRDMQMLSNIQMQALASDTDQEKMVRAILQNAAELFDRTVKVTLALLDWEGEGEQRREVRRDYHLTPQGRLQLKRFAREEGLIGKALVQSSPCVERNAIACAVRRSVQPVGAIQLRKRVRNASFTVAEVEVVERLATVASLALDNMRARVYLEELSHTIAAVVDPSGLQETLDKAVDSAQRVAPEIDCITLWYKDAESDRLILGSQRGVKREEHRSPNIGTDRVVHCVMKRSEPIYALIAAKENCLQGDFISEEEIKSVAAFPLRFGENAEAIGALFFNYRKPHGFPAAEKTLFETFANAAAAAIYITRAADVARRQGRRLGTALAVAENASASLDRDQVLRGVLTVLRDAFRRNPDDDTAPYIMLYDERDRVLELPEVAKEFHQPDQPEHQHRVHLPLDGPGITTRTARKALLTNKIEVDNVRDVHADPDYVEVNSKTQSEMCAGLMSEGRLLGALVIKSAQLAAFDQDDKKLFETAAHQVALALDRVRVAKQRFVDTKKLTSLAWRSEIAHEMNRSLGALSSIKDWFDAYLISTTVPILGTLECRGLISDSLQEFRKMLSTDLFALAELELPKLIERLQMWTGGKKEWQSITFEWPVHMVDMEIALWCNPEMLYWGLQNVIINSVEAIKENGRVGLDVRNALSDKTVEIEVWDNGPGFPEELYLRIGQDAWSTKGENRGYGLFNATLFLEIMGGRLELRRPLPDSAEGARVVFRIPLVRTRSDYKRKN